MTLILGHLEGGSARATGYIMGDTAGTDENGSRLPRSKVGTFGISPKGDGPLWGWLYGTAGDSGVLRTWLQDQPPDKYLEADHPEAGVRALWAAWRAYARTETVGCFQEHGGYYVPGQMLAVTSAGVIKCDELGAVFRVAADYAAIGCSAEAALVGLSLSDYDNGTPLSRMERVLYAVSRFNGNVAGCDFKISDLCWGTPGAPPEPAPPASGPDPTPPCGVLDRAQEPEPVGAAGPWRQTTTVLGETWFRRPEPGAAGSPNATAGVDMDGPIWWSARVRDTGGSGYAPTLEQAQQAADAWLQSRGVILEDAKPARFQEPPYLEVVPVTRADSVVLGPWYAPPHNPAAKSCLRALWRRDRLYTDPKDGLAVMVGAGGSIYWSAATENTGGVVAPAGWAPTGRDVPQAMQAADAWAHRQGWTLVNCDAPPSAPTTVLGGWRVLSRDESPEVNWVRDRVSGAEGAGLEVGFRSGVFWRGCAGFGLSAIEGHANEIRQAMLMADAWARGKGMVLAEAGIPIPAPLDGGPAWLDAQAQGGAVCPL